MATYYRGVEVGEALLPILPHMRSVDESREALAALGQRWDMLDVLSGVVDIGTEVNRTRTQFDALNDRLVNALATEGLKKVTASLGAKAQVTVDILIRNLFERTADIGFLATDEDIGLFLSRGGGPTGEDIRHRLVEYQRKYSVYDNVVLLDRDGHVRAAAVPDGLPAICRDDFVGDTLGTSAPYVESFAPSDLTSGHDPALIYAHRIMDSSAGVPRGVLALLFGFAAELAGIFTKLLVAQDWTVLTLLDAHGAVLASSDPAQIAPGSRLTIEAGTSHRILRHAGRRYIAVARTTTGYQGYVGPGWRGCALVPVEVAFEDDGAAIVLDEDRSRMIARNAHLFADDVRDIPVRAEAIQTELNRTVWNGALALSEGEASAADASQAIARRTLLSEISATGARTRRIFSRAIATLNQTVVGSIVADCGASAALAIDIMDRNLYERANDCRWWALTTRFRQRLAQAVVTETERAELTAILASINTLYTVYTNLILFDRDGMVRAVSDPAQAALVGSILPPTLVGRFMARAESAFYGVSDFAATPLYADQPTYIYGAPVLHPKEPDRIVGGIAIVFDATPQLQSMLADCVPAVPNPPPGSGLVFVDADRRILSSTLDDHPVGATLDLPPALFAADGRVRTEVISRAGELYAAGVCAGSGYREFKGPEDRYRNTVFGVRLVHLCAHSSTSRADKAFEPETAKERPTGPLRQLATFQIGDRQFAFDASDAVEAITLDRVARSPDSSASITGYAVYGGAGLVVLEAYGLFGTEPVDRSPRARTVIVFRAAAGRYGLVVDALCDVRMVEADRIRDNDPSYRDSSAVSAIVQSGTTVTLLLDPDRLATLLLNPRREELVSQSS